MTHPVVEVRRAQVAPSLPARAALHPARKLFHFLTGLILALLTRNLPRPLWPRLSLLIFILSLLFETLRLQNPSGSLNSLILSLFRPFARASETHEFAGILYYTLGVTLVSHLFSRTAATLAILALATLDPIAALLATLLTPKLPPATRIRTGKSIAGFVFAAFAGVLVVGIALGNAVHTSLEWEEGWAVAVLVGGAGATAELLVPTPRPVWGGKRFPIGLDDNVVIPVVCAIVVDVLLGVSMHRVELAPLLFSRTSLGR